MLGQIRLRLFMSVYKLVSMLQVMANFGRAQDCVCENVTVSAASNLSTWRQLSSSSDLTLARYR